MHECKVEGFFNRATKVVNTMDLQEDLTARGFTHLKVRSHGRYDLNPPKLAASRYLQTTDPSSSSSPKKSNIERSRERKNSRKLEVNMLVLDVSRAQFHPEAVHEGYVE